MAITPLERAARALHRARMAGQHPKPDNYPWEDLPRRSQALLRRDAYAVIEAIREPSEAMEAAGGDIGIWDFDLGLHNDATAESEAAKVYTAMIDQLLEEGA